MHKTHIGEEDWGFADYQQRREDVKQRKMERRQKKMTKRREKREAYE